MPKVCQTGTMICVLCNLLFTLASFAAEEPKPRLLILGDSLTAGYGIPKSTAYPALLQAKINDAKLGWEVANGGRSGDTTRDGLTRLSWLLKKPADILMIALGGNDGLRGVSPAAMKKNLAKIISEARKKSPSIRIVMAGMQMPDNFGKDFQSKFEAVYAELAKSEKATLIPFLLQGMAGDSRYNLEDQIHPNEAGHKIIAEHVWKTLEGLLKGDAAG